MAASGKLAADCEVNFTMPKTGRGTTLFQNLVFFEVPSHPIVSNTSADSGVQNLFPRGRPVRFGYI
jgi:hypothetical protein